MLKHYAFDVCMHPKTIIDAGANIGLTSIYFAARFPEAKIFAIEPEENNFKVLEKNTAPYDNIIPIQSALWSRNEEINLIDPGLGFWGFMTKGDDGGNETQVNLGHRVKGVTVDHIMSEHSIKFLDILKVDIEGAEREVFQEPSHWIDKVGNIIVEIHEDMKPGCTDSVNNATKAFAKKWFYGENVYMARDNSGIQVHQEALPSQTNQLKQQRL
jgi:FkbM family methyltransferase